MHNDNTGGSVADQRGGTDDQRLPGRGGGIDLTATVFEIEGANTATAAGHFVAGAQLPDSAFGNLPVSYKLANQYQEFFGQVQDQLATLEKSMHACAERLAATADNYRKAEEANTLHR